MSLSKLHSATKDGDLVLVKRLVEVEGHDPQDRTPDYWPNWRRTPLHLASGGGHLATVQYLVDDKHCDPNCRDDEKRTPLHFACDGGSLAVVQYLVDDKHCDPNCRDDDMKTPLILACRRGHLAVVRYLVDDKNCDPNCRTGSKRTPLHKACEEGHLEVVQYLVDDKHCDPNCKDDRKRAPLYFACKKGHLPVVQYLIDDKHCDPFCGDNKMITPLHIACGKGHLAIAQYLVNDKHCDPNCRDDWKMTPLHYACWNGHLAVVQYLFDDKHCDPNSMNCLTSTPLHLACGGGHMDIIKYFIECNPELLYAATLNSGYPACPGQAATKVFAVGHPKAGKSTLTKALRKNNGFVLSRFTDRFLKVSDVEQQTAGIIPYLIKSKQFGLTIIFDFAGHEEFYASHDAVVQRTLADSPGLFLVLASLSRKIKEFTHSITYWLSLVANQAASLDTKPHVLIVATHSDQVSKEEKALKKSAVASLCTNSTFSNLSIGRYIEIDCRYPESTAMAKLRESLATCLETLRCTVPLDAYYHFLYIFLLDRFTLATAVQLGSIAAALEHEENYFYQRLPKSYSELDASCQLLSHHGRILYLRCEESVADSWIVMDQHALLARVNGTIFAPEGFTEHQALASSTGVVPRSKLSTHFPDLDSTMLTQFLTFFEFCCHISDPETLQLLSQCESISGETFFFFPTLVREDPPEKLWEPNERSSYHSGWLLQCIQPEHFFTPRFHQILLVRLSLELDSAELYLSTSEHPAIHRQCKVWKNGLYWSQGSGVEGLVEVTSKKVMVLVRSLGGHEMAAVKLRSTIIRKVLDAQAKFCASAVPTEHYVHPSDATQYPLKSPSDLNLFSITAVTRAVVKGEPCVVGTTGPPLEVDELLHFEPYAHLGEEYLRYIFDDSSHKPMGSLLTAIAECNYTRQDQFIELLQVSRLQLHERCSHLALKSPITELKVVFEIWEDRDEATRQHLRTKLNKFSIFAGRTPL